MWLVMPSFIMTTIESVTWATNPSLNGYSWLTPAMGEKEHPLARIFFALGRREWGIVLALMDKGWEWMGC